MKVASYLSKYLKAIDLPKPQLMTIEHVEEEQVGDDDRLVVYFTEDQRGVVLGPTTLGQIVEAVGSDDTDNWIGCPIVIYNDPSVMYGSRKTGGIRFRKPTGDHPRKVIEVKASNSNSMHGNQHANDDLPF